MGKEFAEVQHEVDHDAGEEEEEEREDNRGPVEVTSFVLFRGGCARALFPLPVFRGRAVGVEGKDVLGVEFVGVGGGGAIGWGGRSFWNGTALERMTEVRKGRNGRNAGERSRRWIGEIWQSWGLVCRRGLRFGWRCDWKGVEGGEGLVAGGIGMAWRSLRRRGSGLHPHRHRIIVGGIGDGSLSFGRGNAGVREGIRGSSDLWRGGCGRRGGQESGKDRGFREARRSWGILPSWGLQRVIGPQVGKGAGRSGGCSWRAEVRKRPGFRLW